MNKVKTVFIGTSSFAVTILQKLLTSELLSIEAVITQPDKPSGRKQSLQMPKIKEYMIKTAMDIRFYQPSKLKMEADKIMQETNPDLIIVADYGQIIPEIMLQKPTYKCLNIHGSLLPDLRGATPIPIAILKGYTTSGVSIPLMTNGLDSGPVLAEATIKIDPDDTTASLKHKMAVLGAGLLLATLPKWLGHQLVPQTQDEDKATYTFVKDLSKQNAQITTATSIQYADRMVRAFFPWPIAWVMIKHNGQAKRLKILSAEKRLDSNLSTTGTIHKRGNELLLILKDGCLNLKQIQLEGKQVMAAKDYLFLANSRIE